eukprot:tig00020660_g12567.t1
MHKRQRSSSAAAGVAADADTHASRREAASDAAAKAMVDLQQLSSVASFDSLPDELVRHVFSFVDAAEALQKLPAVCTRFRELLPGVQWDSISLAFDTSDGPLDYERGNVFEACANAEGLLRLPKDDEDAPSRPWRRSMRFWRRAIDRGLLGPQSSLELELRGPSELELQFELEPSAGAGEHQHQQQQLLPVVLAHGRELVLAAHGLMGLLAAAARASADSLTTLRLVVRNLGPAAAFLNAAGDAELGRGDAARERESEAGLCSEDLALRAAVALAPCRRLETFDASFVFGTDGDRDVPAARPGPRWAAAFGALGGCLRDLELPQNFARAHTNKPYTYVAFPGPGEDAELVGAETGPGFAALAAGPAGRSLVRLSAACFGRISQAGLESLFSLPRLASASLPLAELGARPAAALARAPRLRSLLALVQVRPDSDGGASTFRALSAALDGMLSRPYPELRHVSLVLKPHLGISCSDPAGLTERVDVASEPLASLIQAARGTLFELRYELCARRPPGARELAACAACPSLHRVMFSHGMEGEEDLLGYAPFPSKLRPSSKFKIDIGAASAGLAAYARSVLSGWFPSAELSARAVESAL